ncbi:hypothetical protein [Bacillus cereus]|nr:hypothetical protein [Bacillus cereus]EJR91156.1 hypothetical protein IKG_05793 [Bacillus cereus VD200]
MNKKIGAIIVGIGLLVVGTLTAMSVKIIEQGHAVILLQSFLQIKS